MKKDIYIKITCENKKYLHELYRFVSNWDYPKEERDFYKDDLGKIETKSCCFRFIKHINVSTVDEKPFFLSKPKENDLIDITMDEFEDSILKMIPSNFP